MAKKKEPDVMDKLVSLCKRKGYIFQSSEIYGGINSCWDYGPLGVELKRNIKDLWWKAMVYERTDVEGLDSSILMHPRVWEASGHVENFTDPMVDCKECKARFRADDIDSSECPNCGGKLTEARQFNLMFKTFMGAVEDDASMVFLRPETAQGIYVNFLNVAQSMRRKIPFGIAQMGKAFRNEITPKNFIFRTREFEQMEMQYFIRPEEGDKWFDYWLEERLAFYRRLGFRDEKIRTHPHGPDELAHYAIKAVDVEFEFPFGFSELEGIHNRGDYDLSRHKEFSKRDLSYFDEVTKERFIPYIIETSAGVDRTLLAILAEAYDEEPERVVLRLSPLVAPIRAAIFPLVNRDGMPEKALEVEKLLRQHFKVFYDKGGSVGRRYRRMDEAGTPFCITIDSDTMADGTVTLRDRDTMEQERYVIEDLPEVITKKSDEWTRKV